MKGLRPYDPAGEPRVVNTRPVAGGVDVEIELAFHTFRVHVREGQAEYPFRWEDGTSNFHIGEKGMRARVESLALAAAEGEA